MLKKEAGATLASDSAIKAIIYLYKRQISSRGSQGGVAELVALVAELVAFFLHYLLCVFAEHLHFFSQVVVEPQFYEGLITAEGWLPLGYS